MHKSFTADPKGAVDVFLYTAAEFKLLENDPFPSARSIAEGQDFTGAAGQIVLVPGDKGDLARVLYGLGKGKDALAVAGLSAKLPKGTYRVLASGGLRFDQIAAGWADGAYRFDRYLKDKAAPPQLLLPEGQDADALSREADACALLRDLVNTPAADMGPQDIQATISDMAERFGATLTTIIGDALLEQNGSDKTRILQATIWLADMKDFAEMNGVWDAWVAPGHAPARACGESALATPDYTVEIIVIAAAG